MEGVERIQYLKIRGDRAQRSEVVKGSLDFKEGVRFNQEVLDLVKGQHEPIVKFGMRFYC